jgi:hypothetical protein
MKYRLVYVNITDEHGTLLDRFAVTHWQDERCETEEGDFENFGSHASNALLAERIERAATERAA